MTTRTCRTRYTDNTAITCTLGAHHAGEHEDHVFAAPSIVVFSDHPYPEWLPKLRLISRLERTRRRPTARPRRRRASTGPPNRTN